VLNQYSNRTVAGFVEVVGVALATKPVYGSGKMVTDKGEYGRRELRARNASGSVWQQVTRSLDCVKNQPLVRWGVRMLLWREERWRRA
jgi:hypothetical protein